jgi:mannose-6-phosphate isomerase-like protein (cupin superfamily)
MRSASGKVVVRFIVVLVMLVVGGMVTVGQAPRAKGDPTTLLSKAEIDSLLSTFPKTGEQGKVVDVGNHNVAVAFQKRSAIKLGAPVNSISHSKISEVYYILSGSGTMVTGGTVAQPKPWAADSDLVRIAAGPSISGVMTGGYSRYVSAGDVIVVPPGTPHGWAQIDDQVSYLMIRSDFDKLLPAGYVNPAINK